MICKLCEDKLIEYLYGELSEEDAAAMKQHLEASAACRQAYNDFASVLKAVSNVEGEEGPPQALHTRLMGHAQEAGTKRRNFWAWVFRPAVTTAVIGAITAGVYFATLRHRPPSFRDERIVLEKSFTAKPEQRGALGPSGAGEKVDTVEKEAGRDQALPAAHSTKPTAPFEGAGAVPEKKQRVYENSIERAKGSLEEDAMDGERPAPVVLSARKAESVPAETYSAISGKTDSGRRSAPESAPLFESAVSSSLQKRTSSKEPIPNPIAGALDLASEGRCAEAEAQVGSYATEHPAEEACGTGWLEAARCYLKKGDPAAARKAAEKALDIPASAKEARAFLDSLALSAD